MFSAFRARIARGYVLLAVLLIVVIVGVSSALAFLLFSRGVHDALTIAAQRVSDADERARTQHLTPAQAAPQLVRSVSRSQLQVRVVDAQGRLLAQRRAAEPPGGDHAFAVALVRAIGLPRVRVPVNGGTVILSAEVDRFGGLLLWYWSIVLPIGLVAIVVAWLVGRRITARAVEPVAQVTVALRKIAAGDFTPAPVHPHSSDLRELTQAYNDVAYALSAATADRERTQAQMRQFIADAGHELRTPLTVIMGYLDVLRQGIVQGEQTQRAYETMLDESRKMRRLIETLLLLARLERPATAKPVEFDLNELARNAAASFEPVAPGRVRFHGNGTAIVSAQEDEVLQAIRNAIDNALKYAPQSDVDVSVSTGDAGACVEIADRGPGMSSQDAEHAFDRFYRGEARSGAEGSGLGLAIAKLAIERAGGTASLESAPGAGTRVRYCLPVR